MRAYVGDSPYDTALENCCGINEVGGFFSGALSWRSEKEYPTIKNLPHRGCGIFISTLLGSQKQAYRELLASHTLLFRTGPHINTGSDASTEGSTKGVYLCVFKYGKDKS